MLTYTLVWLILQQLLAWSDIYVSLLMVPKKNPNYLLNEQYDQHEAMAALTVVKHWS